GCRTAASWSCGSLARAPMMRSTASPASGSRRTTTRRAAHCCAPSSTRRGSASLVADQGPPDIAIPSFRAHELTGDLADHWSVRINGNRRVTFHLIDQDVELVDYQHYHCSRTMTSRANSPPVRLTCAHSWSRSRPQLPLLVAS